MKVNTRAYWFSWLLLTSGVSAFLVVPPAFADEISNIRITGMPKQPEFKYKFEIPVEFDYKAENVRPDSKVTYSGRIECWRVRKLFFWDNLVFYAFHFSS